LGPGYQVPFSVRIRTQAEITTWTVWMITKARQAEEIIAGGKADIVALRLCVPLWPFSRLVRIRI
jgi:NADPH2 dehydrogenase